MKTVVVTAAIIKNGDRYLIAQRKVGSHQELKWEFPGGKVEVGEHPESCLQREIAEELNIIVEVEDIFQVVSYNYEHAHVILLCYNCSITQGKPRADDCQDFRWVTINEMKQYRFAPADIPVINRIIETAGANKEEGI